MTQEEKAKAYEQALKMAKEIKSKILSSHLSTESCKAVSEYIDEIIPELRESEDELSFLDTLSEEPDNGLEEAAEEYYDEMWDELGGFTETRDGCYDIFFPSKAIRDTFKAGAEWKESQMPMPEDTVLFQKGVAEGRRLEREDMLKDAVECELYWDGDFLAIDLDMAALGYSEKDKVKVIVIKEEE